MQVMRSSCSNPLSTLRSARCNHSCWPLRVKASWPKTWTITLYDSLGSPACTKHGVSLKEEAGNEPNVLKPFSGEGPQTPHFSCGGGGGCCSIAVPYTNKNVQSKIPYTLTQRIEIKKWLQYCARSWLFEINVQYFLDTSFNTLKTSLLHGLFSLWTGINAGNRL